MGRVKGKGMSRRAFLFLVVGALSCGGGLPPRVTPDLDAGKKSRRGPAAKKERKEAEKRHIARYLAPVPVAQEVDILKHLRYQEYPQDHGAPYRVGWTEPGETYPLDSVESVLDNMRPVYWDMAAIVERPGAIEPADYDELRRHVGRLRMHADEIYRLKAGPEVKEVFHRETYAETTPSNEWCLKVMAGRLARATFLEETKELRKLWDKYKAICRACELDLVASERETRRR